jgi:hypothetical protein
MVRRPPGWSACVGMLSRRKKLAAQQVSPCEKVSDPILTVRSRQARRSVGGTRVALTKCVGTTCLGAWTDRTIPGGHCYDSETVCEVTGVAYSPRLITLHDRERWLTRPHWHLGGCRDH